MLIPYVLLSLKSLGFLSGLGANPVEAIIHDTGLWGIRFLMLTLLITPVALIKRIFSGRPLPVKPDRDALSYWVARDEPVQPKERFLKRY